jgi:hypothetical protein
MFVEAISWPSSSKTAEGSERNFQSFRLGQRSLIAVEGEELGRLHLNRAGNMQYVESSMTSAQSAHCPAQVTARGLWTSFP